MKTLIDLNGADTLVQNVKNLVADAIDAHNSNENAHVANSSALGFAVGDTKPANMALWFDTSDYEEEEG